MFKKVLSIVIIGVFIFSSAQGVYALTNDETAELIAGVKAQLDVGDGYEDFSYNISIEDNVSYLSLNWSNPDTNGYYNVTVDDTGYITSVDRYEKSDVSFGTVSPEETQKAVEDYLKKVVPAEYIGGLRLTDVDTMSGSRRYRYNYYVNNVLCLDEDLWVEISSVDKEIKSYCAINKKIYENTYPDRADVISAENIISTYKNMCKMGFSYMADRQRLYSAESDGKYTFPAYYIDEAPAYIDAKTGEAVSDLNGYGKQFSNAMATEMAMAEDTAGGDSGAYDALTPAEISAIEEKNDILTAEEALEKARLCFDVEKNDALNYRLYSVDRNKQYYWEIDNGTVDITINASTGRLISYYNYKEMNRNWEENSETANPNYDKMYAEASRLVNTYAADLCSQTEFKYNEPENEYSTPEFIYTRLVNGIPYSENSITVLFNKFGELAGYDCNWDDYAKFDSLDGAVGKDKAFENILAIEQPKLGYIMTEDGEKLVYSFDCNNVFLNKLGERIDRRGKAYYDAEDAVLYNDIGGSKYEEYIKVLFESGYRVDREQFKPTEPISTEDLCEFFQLGVDHNDKGYVIGYYDDEKAYGEYLTYYDLAEILARGKVNMNVLKHSEIFDTSFYKNEIPAEYKGAVAVCYGLGYMKGNEGVFKGDEIVTNEEAAMILYNYLINR